MKKQKIATAALIVLMSSFIIGLGWTAQGATEATEQAQASGTMECNLKIAGMSCGMCAAKIKSGLKDLVISSDIDVKKGTGKFAYAEGKTSCKELATKITDTGFKAVED